ncbi:MAG: hypothetical protein JNM99_09490 [Verrucomicrobiaceae bacterium]|nr:hypothetical protein [Verrucomicrobiaceae bacterium]
MPTILLPNDAVLVTGKDALPLVPREFLFAPIPSVIPAGCGGIAETVTYTLEGTPPYLARGLRAATADGGEWAVVIVAKGAGEVALTAASNRALTIMAERLAQSETGGLP